MPEIDEGVTVWRVRQENPDKYEKFRVKDVGKGVKLVLGKVKGRMKWEVQSVMLEKDRFKTRDEVERWIKEHGFKIMATDYSVWAIGADRADRRRRLYGGYNSPWWW